MVLNPAKAKPWNNINGTNNNNKSVKFSHCCTTLVPTIQVTYLLGIGRQADMDGPIKYSSPMLGCEDRLIRNNRTPVIIFECFASETVGRIEYYIQVLH